MSYIAPTATLTPASPPVPKAPFVPAEPFVPPVPLMPSVPGTAPLPEAASTPRSQAPVFIYNTHAEAETAIRALSQAGLDLACISLIGKGWHSEEHPVGFYTQGDRVRAWGGTGAFWGGIWGLLIAPAVFFLPGIGPVALAGPLVMALVGALEGAVLGGGLGALTAALTRIGVTEADAVQYLSALKADKFVLMVEGTAAEQASARQVLTAGWVEGGAA
jgi:hypothetical protein